MANLLTLNRLRYVTIAILAVLFGVGIIGMDTDDAIITILRGLSLGMVIFLVASGLSLIFGLMDVLNLAHGELFMLGAYVGWTVYVRPDTFMDILIPVMLLGIGYVLIPLWQNIIPRFKSEAMSTLVTFVAVVIGLGFLIVSLRSFPITIWDTQVFNNSPSWYASQLQTGLLRLPVADDIVSLDTVGLMIGIVLGSSLLGIAYVSFRARNQYDVVRHHNIRPALMQAGALLLIALVAFFGNDALTDMLIDVGTTWRFFLAMGVAFVFGLVVGSFIEIALIRPLYSRPIYQLMITLGLGFILIEVARNIWGRPEFVMARPALFNGTGEGCPATTIGDIVSNQCSTFILFDGRVRVYNELFIIVMGFLILTAVWILLQRTRIGMIIRAGVQDSEMVEALGINVRQVFTFVFALGVALATLGGVLAAASDGLSTVMGTRLLLLALIALAIGGLTSFPGAAIGAILVGLLQQFIIKYGQIGINLPFIDEPFKPSPPLVPASTVLLMVIILLVLPNGLFGRNE